MTQKVLSIALQTKIGPVTFPDLTLSNGCRAILPFGLSLDGVSLSWATAQPIGRTVVDDTPEYLFFTPQGIPGQFALKGVTVAALENGMQDKTGDLLVLSVSDPKKENPGSCGCAACPTKRRCPSFCCQTARRSSSPALS